MNQLSILEYQNGIYQGLVHKNQKSGLGVLLWDDGHFYLGEWEKDQIQGMGIIFFPQGGYIYGNFKNNRIVENPVFKLPDKQNLLILQFIDGKLNHVLQEIQQNNDYIEFVNNLQNFYSDSSESQIENNFFFKYLEFQDGGYYIGICQNEIPNGLGIIGFPDQRKDYGFYKNGVLHCIGKINFQNGSYYEGMIFDNILQGLGVLYENNSWKYGIFQDDLCQTAIQVGKNSPQEAICFMKQILHQNSLNFIDQSVDKAQDSDQIQIQYQNILKNTKNNINQQSIKKQQKGSSFKQNKDNMLTQQQILQKYESQKKFVNDYIINKH